MESERFNSNYDGYPIVDLDSDPEKAESSSEDDIDVILHGTPEQKRRLRRRSLGQGSSSEDEFEKDMRKELNETVKEMQKKQSLEIANSAAQPSGLVSEEKERAYYDNIYFDSDSDEEETSQDKRKRKHTVPCNDDLMYDPSIDDDNEKWVTRQRRRYQPQVHADQPSQPEQHQKPKPLPHSDAVLNCPACMTLLCLDCQRHDVHKNQYRAMFVKNCNVKKDECVRCPTETNKKRQKKRKQKQEQDTSDKQEKQELENDTEDAFNPVQCSVCTTEVGVFDKDEVFHFFNVLASYS